MNTLRTGLAFLLLSFTALAPDARALGGLPGADDFALRPEMLRFRWMTLDGGSSMPCRHEIEDPASQDWKVVCTEPGSPSKREYRVHLWVTSYKRTTVPKQTYEVLYWVTDRTNPKKLEGTGTSAWFHLKEKSSLHALTVSQSVEKDTAGLYLDIQLP